MPWYVWAFDGVGGAVLVAMIGWGVRRVFSTPAPPSVSADLHSVSDSNVAIGNTVNQQIVQHHHVSERPLVLEATEPSPCQIMAALNALSPYERHRAPESYQGLSVLWPLTLVDIHPHGGTWNVMFRGRGEGYHPAIVEADISDLPPELKIAPADSLVWVRGRVATISLSLRITLEANPEIVEVQRP